MPLSPVSKLRRSAYSASNGVFANCLLNGERDSHDDRARQEICYEMRLPGVGTTRHDAPKTRSKDSAQRIQEVGPGQSASIKLENKNGSNGIIEVKT